MKRSIATVCAWVIVAVLFFVLIQVLTQEDTTAKPPPITSTQTEEMAALIQQRQQLEKQLQNLEQDYAKASQAPSSIFVLLATQEEAVITEAATMLDTLNISGLLGISEAMLAEWSQNGLPAYVGERLAAEWEVCLLLEETPPAQTQEQLAQLQLPRAVCAYNSPKNIMPYDAQELLNCGIRILVEDSVQTQYSMDDGLWHVASLGNMNQDGIRVYEKFRNAGSALVNVVGSYQADQIYVKENLEGLLELIREDSHLGTVQSLRLETAMLYHEQYLTRLEALRQEWMANRGVLQQELQAVMDKITDASILLNQ